MGSINSLIDLDLKFYASQNSDLKGYTDNELILHYLTAGYYEGRMSSELAIRENFLKSISEESILEIGPFTNPCFTGKNVEYVDIISTAELKEKAKKLGLKSENVPIIDYVTGGNLLDVVKKQYKVIFSSHNIEHHPDLISHLNNISSRLTDNGSYAIIVPNARYCFDANLPLSKISEVLNAFFEKRKNHTIGSIVEHRALTTHNDHEKHWIDRKTNQNNYNPIDYRRVSDAIYEFEQANGGYIDVHAWQFDPFSFSDIIRCLIEIDYINFSSISCNGPVFGRNEFTAILKK